MATKSDSKPGMSLDEAYKFIGSSLEKVFKNSKGSHYCEVPHAKLIAAHTAIYDALKVAPEVGELREKLETAMADVKKVNEWNTEWRKRMKEVEDKAAKAEEAHKETLAKHEKIIAELRLNIEYKKTKLEELSKSRADTAAALEEAKKKTKDPAFKFSPAEAAAIQAEINNFDSDMQLINGETASITATMRAMNVRLDETLKQVAAAKKEAEDAKFEVLSLKRQAAATRKGIAECFSHDDIDWQRIRDLMGEAVMHKLQVWVKTPVSDVRDRVSKATGFFAAAADHFDRSYRGFVAVIKLAFDVLKETGGVWTAAIGPWVNELLKDVVFFSLRTPAYYKADLDARLSAVRAANPALGFKGKRIAGKTAGKSRGGWKARLSDARKRLALIFDSGLKRAKAAALATSSFVSRMIAGRIKLARIIWSHMMGTDKAAQRRARRAQKAAAEDEVLFDSAEQAEGNADESSDHEFSETCHCGMCLIVRRARSHVPDLSGPSGS